MNLSRYAIIALVATLAIACGGGLPTPVGPTGSTVEAPAATNAIGAISGGLSPSLASPDAPGAPGNGTLSGVDVKASILVSGTSTRGAVMLNANAPAGGLVVQLSADSSSISVPPSVTVPAGVSVANFTLSVGEVTQDVRAVVTAAAGGVSKTVSVRITPPIGLASLVFTPFLAIGGSDVTGTLTLTSDARVDTPVRLESTSADAIVPVSVTVLAGHHSAEFTVRTLVIGNYANPRVVASGFGSTVAGEFRIYSRTSGVAPFTLDGIRVGLGSYSSTVSLPQGDFYVVDVSGTHLDLGGLGLNPPGTTASFSGTGVTRLDGPFVASAVQLLILVSVDPAATLGPHDLLITINGFIVTLPGAITVVP